MTRKDYVLIAETLRQTLADIRRDIDSDSLSDRGRAVLSGESAGIQTVALRLAERLRQDNAAFDARRFLTACSL
jgi:hypothetical protein